MQAVTIGPWMFAIGLVAIVAGLVVADVAAWVFKRRTRVDAGTPLWLLVIVALAAARIAFVLREWAAYAASPLAILDLRDGGYLPLAGVIVLAIGALAWIARRPALRKPLSISLGAGLAVWCAVAWGVPRIGAAPAARVLPDVVLQRLDGMPVRLRSLEGRPLVVNIWATWCPSCRSEMPMLVAASKRMPGVRFVFVDHGESATVVAAHVKAMGMDPASVLLDRRGQLMRDFHFPGCPATVFAKAGGGVTQAHLGPLSIGTLRADLQPLLVLAD